MLAYWIDGAGIHAARQIPPRAGECAGVQDDAVHTFAIFSSDVRDAQFLPG